MANSMDKLEKVKRRKLNWVKILFDLNEQSMIEHYFKLLGKVHSKRKRSTNLSINRCAYSTIRTFYSTTSIEDTLRKLGL